MSRCIALVPSNASALIWDRCARTALRGDRYCADHRLSLDGAVMGFLDTKDYRHAQAKFRTKALRKSARPRTHPSAAQRAAPELPAKSQIKARADTKTLRRLGKRFRPKKSGLEQFLGA